MEEVYIPEINNILDAINTKCKELKNITIIARTHGQPASPTKLGKEFKVFWTRVTNQLSTLKNIPNSAKFATLQIHKARGSFPTARPDKILIFFLHVRSCWPILGLLSSIFDHLGLSWPS